jgi:DNA-binding NtrC family response regulator
VILARGETITSQHLKLGATAEQAIADLKQKLQANECLADVLADVERLMLARAMERTGDNRHHAARLLGLDLASLDDRLEAHGVGR